MLKYNTFSSKKEQLKAEISHRNANDIIRLAINEFTQDLEKFSAPSVINHYYWAARFPTYLSADLDFTGILLSSFFSPPNL